jgi:hypothetical protein
MAMASYVSGPPPDPDTFIVGVSVFLYDPGASVDQQYQMLPNVRCLSIEWFDGPRPPEAIMRYDFDQPYLDTSDPRYFQDVLPVTSSGPMVVNPGDRLVVRVYASDGSQYLMFDGFAETPQADVGEQAEVVQFLCFGTPIREFDRPLKSAVFRDGQDFHLGKDVETRRLMRFNPDGEPNCSPDTFDHFGATRVGTGTDPAPVASDLSFPVFVDETIKRSPDQREHWTLGGAARFIMFSRQLDGTDIEQYITFYDPSDYDAILECRMPFPDPTGIIDPGDPSTYVDSPIEVQDLTINTRRWPEALFQLIDPEGFRFQWQLAADDAGNPDWTLVISRKDADAPLKQLYLQAAGGDAGSVTLDWTQTNTARFTLQRDTHDLANQFTAETANTVYQAAFVLGPGFEVAASDANPATLSTFNLDANGVGKADPTQYRVYHLNEAGDGVWDFVANAMNMTPPDMTPVFGKPGKDKKPTYQNLHRPPLSKLLTRDDENERQKYQLYVTTDYTGAIPGPLDISKLNNWQRVTKGYFELLPDRCGIRLTAPNLENWNISGPIAPGPPGNPQFLSGAVRVVTCQANPNAGGETTTPRFWFILECVIEGDFGIPKTTAKRRDATPTPFTIERRIDERGWFQNTVISAASMYVAAGGIPKTVDDDTTPAVNRMAALRRAHELGETAGSPTVARFTLGYRIGDRVWKISGRNCSLAQNLDGINGEGYIYPAIVGIRWNFDGKQETTLSLSDRRADPPPERRRPSGRA